MKEKGLYVFLYLICFIWIVVRVWLLKLSIKNLYFFLLQYKSELISSFSERALPGFSNGTLRTIIDTTLKGLDKIGEAHKLMESNKNTGKIVLEVITEKHEEL